MQCEYQAVDTDKVDNFLEVFLLVHLLFSNEKFGCTSDQNLRLFFLGQMFMSSRQ